MMRLVAKGPDPRASPRPRADVPQLLREGAHEWTARRFWHAHESWEEAWHALRAVGETGPAEFLHGMILAAAALENANRDKEAGFKRQMAEGLFLLREHLESADALGIAHGRVFLDALSHLYVDACRRLEWRTWQISAWRAPTPEIA